MRLGLDILNLLSDNKDFSEIIIAPNAPPIDRSMNGCEILMNVVFSVADVQDTLATLSRTAFGAAGAQRPAAGSFCLGIRDVGRFRVNHVTQRGSPALRITRVPIEIPSATTVSDDQEAIALLMSIMEARRSGVILVHGPSATANSTLVYALLDGVNRSQRRILYIMERALSFLMMHHDCLAIQSELTTDVDSMDEGIANAFLMQPDIAYIGDLRITDELPSLADLLDASLLSILSSTSENGASLKARTREILAGEAATRILAVAKVHPMPGGKLAVILEPNAGEECSS